MADVVTVTTVLDVVDGSTNNIASLLSSPGADGVVSLREAVIAANSTPSSNSIVVPAGVYTLTRQNPGGVDEGQARYGDLDVTRELAITGAGSASTIIRAGTDDTNGIDRMFSVRTLTNAPAVNFTLSGVTLQFGSRQGTATAGKTAAGGALEFRGGWMELSDVVFDRNATRDGGGGALACWQSAGVSLSGCVFSGNRAVGVSTQAAGGAVLVGERAKWGAMFVLSNCGFVSNRTDGVAAGPGGAVHVVKLTPAWGNLIENEVAFSACTLTTNWCGGVAQNGGAISSEGRVIIGDGSLIVGNICSGYGGGVYLEGVSGNVHAVTSSTFLGNTAGPGLSGGAVWLNSGGLYMTGCRLAGNTPAGSTVGCADGVISAYVPDNWWAGGGMTGGGGGVINPNANPPMVLRVTANPAAAQFGVPLPILLAVTNNSLNQPAPPPPDGAVVNMSCGGGVITPGSGILTSGVFCAEFVPGGGPFFIMGTVDGMQFFISGTEASLRITSSNACLFQAGTTNAFRFNSTYLGSPFTVTGALPVGVGLTNSGFRYLLTGTPSLSAAGTYPLVVTTTEGTNTAQQNFTLVVNGPPVAGTDRWGTHRSMPLDVPDEWLLGNDFDGDGDPLVVTTVASVSGQGGAISGESGRMYVPPAGFVGQDSFSYVIADGRGASSTGWVFVTVRPPGQPFQSATNLVRSGSQATVGFRGLPGAAYRVEMSTNLGAPWIGLPGVLTADETGAFGLTFTNAPGDRCFFRAVQVP